MKSSHDELVRFEPTAFSAARRFWVTVLVTTLLVAAIAVGSTLITHDEFRATGRLAVPAPTTTPVNSGQYLDKQVLLLESDDVAQRAVAITNGKLGRPALDTAAFSGDDATLSITPPSTSSSGTYGAGTITVSFVWPDAELAQVGVNAVLQAFSEARAAAIQAQGAETIAGIEAVIDDPRSKDQRADVKGQLTRALVDERVDLAQLPTIDWAVQPSIPINNNSKQMGGIGLFVGLLFGLGIAYARARLHPVFADRLDPAALYDIPLLGEVPGPAPRSRHAVRLPLAEASRTCAAEAFRLLGDTLNRTRSEPASRKSIAVLSPVGGPQTGQVVANLALALAEDAARRVLVVDADPAGGLSNLLLPAQNGVAVSHGAGIVRLLPEDEIVIERAHSCPGNASVAVLRIYREEPGGAGRVAYSEAVDKLLASATNVYDIVLVACPALLRDATAPTLAAAADAAIVLVDARDLIMPHIRLKHQLGLINTDVLGYVFSRPTVRSDQNPINPNSEAQVPQVKNTATEIPAQSAPTVRQRQPTDSRAQVPSGK